MKSCPSLLSPKLKLSGFRPGGARCRLAPPLQHRGLHVASLGTWLRKRGCAGLCTRGHPGPGRLAPELQGPPRALHAIAHGSGPEGRRADLHFHYGCAAETSYKTPRQAPTPRMPTGDPACKGPRSHFTRGSKGNAILQRSVPTHRRYQAKRLKTETSNSPTCQIFLSRTNFF